MSLNDDASELLSGLAAIVDDEARLGVRGLGERVATRMAVEWGGQKIYFTMDRARRDKRIYELFDGRNYNRLARLFHVSENTVRKSIARERARKRNVQLSLLPPEQK